MQPSRQLSLSTRPPRAGNCVVYVMSRDQRVQDNHALIAAQAQALRGQLPLIVVFIVRAQSGVRSREHYDFMLTGLQEVAAQLQTLGITFVLCAGDSLTELTRLDEQLHPSSVYFDFSPLSGPRRLARAFAAQSSAACVVVDTHNIIPAWVLSDKKEFAAHTIRRKVNKRLATYLISPDPVVNHPYQLPLTPESLSFADVRNTVLSTLPSSGIVVEAAPGYEAAHAQLKEFIAHGLDHYAHGRNDITTDQQSSLSPYLHFGQISSLRVALDVIHATNSEPLLLQQPTMAQSGPGPSIEDGMNALLEEMIVRKELADNFCYFSSSYTTLAGVAEWAQKSLDQHRDDPRDYVYTRDQWEGAQTHDSSWNAAQTQLMRTGKIHGYMRMYWAKKILEWSASPENAIATAIYLNDHYSIDGGDPNGYAGILWSIGGLHDRAWFERPVYGKIRYMNAGGLARKFDLDRYLADWRPSDL